MNPKVALPASKVVLKGIARLILVILLSSGYIGSVLLCELVENSYLRLLLKTVGILTLASYSMFDTLSLRTKLMDPSGGHKEDLELTDAHVVPENEKAGSGEI